MKEIISNLNYSLSESGNAGKKLNLLIVNNPEGSPRWIMNAECSKPLFLKFYNINSLRSKLLVLSIQLIFLLRIQKLIFKTQTIFLDTDSQDELPLCNLWNKDWALFTGTVGPNNKYLLYELENKKGSFRKIATTAQSQKLIENERNALTRLYSIWPISFEVPTILDESNNSLLLEDISTHGLRCSEMSKLHLNFLSELYEKSSLITETSDLLKAHQINQKLEQLAQNGDIRIPKGLVRKLHKLVDSIDCNEIEIGLCHGDFTPWNMYVTGDKLAVYDWELSSPNMPLGFDAFHFIIQNGILAERKPWIAIKQQIHSDISVNQFHSWLKFKHTPFNNYLKLYLLINTVNYLSLYSTQKNWHSQIDWLLQTWSEGISDVLKNYSCNRELLIMDVFDFLQNKKYAAIKFPNTYPEKLSEYSDIDLCIQKNDLGAIKHFLAQHPLVVHTHSIHKSFMDTAQLALTNGKFLSLDLIWKFKRKNLVMLNASDALNAAFMNNFGVKMLDYVDLARYLGLFYGLNHKPIPLKYQDYQQLIAFSPNPLDKIILKSQNKAVAASSGLTDFIKNNPANKSWNGMLNTFAYFLDSCRQLLFNKGFVITFSGVDGAGKSTVIEKTKLEIEKKLRRKVVVLRHRPSLLPILSAISKGAAAAKEEQESPSHLPRQGNNKNKYSSLLRFLYYYTDYVVGQFYIYFKYIFRGTVVLYDRYYFDFIVDSKRSNILISERLTKFFYRFLLKPDLNFFLFADTTTILKRKQELDEQTILTLTQKYRSLFQELGATKKQPKYVVIENIDLNNTISEILSNTLSIAA